jgi:hypothetical protein
MIWEKFSLNCVGQSLGIVCRHVEDKRLNRGHFLEKNLFLYSSSFLKKKELLFLREQYWKSTSAITLFFLPCWWDGELRTQKIIPFLLSPLSFLSLSWLCLSLFLYLSITSLTLLFLAWVHVYYIYHCFYFFATTSPGLLPSIECTMWIPGCYGLSTWKWVIYFKVRKK